MKVKWNDPLLYSARDTSATFPIVELRWQFESSQAPKVIKKILVEALMNDGVETFKDVLIAHLRRQSKTKLASETSIGRQTLYDLINEDSEFNSTLSTLSLLLKSIAA